MSLILYIIKTIWDVMKYSFLFKTVIWYKIDNNACSSTVLKNLSSSLPPTTFNILQKFSFVLKLLGTTIHEGPCPSVPQYLLSWPWAPGYHEHMPWLSGQPDAGLPVFSFQANLVLILWTTPRDDRLSQPWTAPELNPGLVAWQHEAVTTEPLGFISFFVLLISEQFATHLIT